MEVTLKINGKNVKIAIEPDEMLLTTLRRLGYFSVRCGCQTTNCGLCTIWVDGAPSLSCAWPTFRAPGHEITTLEGLGEEATFLAKCIASEGADQCGYCTTGMMMSAMALKRTSPSASDDEIRATLVGNLCRCTGYESQLRGVRKYLEAAYEAEV